MLPFLEHINQLLWGFPVLILLSSAHLYFTAKLKFPQRLTLKAVSYTHLTLPTIA